MKLQSVDLSQSSSPMKLTNNGPHCTARGERGIQVRKHREERGEKKVKRGEEKDCFLRRWIHELSSWRCIQLIVCLSLRTSMTQAVGAETNASFLTSTRTLAQELNVASVFSFMYLALQCFGCLSTWEGRVHGSCPGDGKEKKRAKVGKGLENWWNKAVKREARETGKPLLILWVIVTSSIFPGIHLTVTHHLALIFHFLTHNFKGAVIYAFMAFNFFLGKSFWVN